MKETLYIIDGFAEIFRAFYGIRTTQNNPEINSSNNAVYGFCRMLIKLYSEFEPDYLVVIIDVPGKTFRHDLFKEYKATYRKTPEEIVPQLPQIFKIIQLLAVPKLGVAGYEADDVIATLSNRILNNPEFEHISLRIVTRDKDLQQLVSKRVALFDSTSGRVIDETELKYTKGIAPWQVVDVLALAGDSVDNVPGVHGIGFKTALLLVQQFGTANQVYANIEKVSRRNQDLLRNGIAAFELSRKLVTLKTDIDVAFSLESARVKRSNFANVVPFLQELGFHDLEREALQVASEIRVIPQSVAQLSLFDLE